MKEGVVDVYLCSYILIAKIKREEQEGNYEGLGNKSI